MLRKWLSFLTVSFLLVSSGLVAKMQERHLVRAAIEIGTSGPKLQVAEVDPQTQHVVKMLHTQRYFVNFYETDAQHQLTPEVMTQGMQAFKEAIAVAHSFNVDGIVAIATASFRAATNGEHYAAEIQRETGIPVYIVDQQLEGELAFQAVRSKLDVDAEHLLVWDIGGGSVQWIATGAEGSVVVGCEKQGVGAFIDFIIEHIQHRNRQEISTPNPMSREEITQAQEYACNLTHNVDRLFKDKIKDDKTVVVGAGSVFGYGIARLVDGKNPVSLEDLSIVVEGLVGKIDADFGGEYAFCEGANAILALGYMKALNIEKVRVVNVNNADGALIYQPFWEG